MSFWTRQRAQRGAVLIHVGIALVALTAFSVFAIDYGVLWASRRQAQNSADAGALAAASSLAFDVSTSLVEAHAKARAAASALVAANPVWGAAPNMEPATDVRFIPCPPGAPGPPDTCVRVDVYRNQDRGNPLPTFFGGLIGVANQGVRATATAQVLSGNEVKCLKPWAVPDKWWDLVDNDPPKDTQWTSEDVYDRYYEQGPSSGEPLPWIHDVYVPEGGKFVAPDGTSYGPSGYDPVNRPGDVGTQVMLKSGNPHQTLTAGWFFPIDLPRTGPATGGDKYRENIEGCPSLPVTVGMTISNEPGNMIGPTKQGVDALIAQDPTASYQNGQIVNSCAGDNPPCATVSPRLVPIAVFSPDDYYTTLDKTQGRFTFQVTKIVGFFVEEMQGNDLYGRLMIYPSQYNSTAGTNPATFLRVVILVR